MRRNNECSFAEMRLVSSTIFMCFTAIFSAWNLDSAEPNSLTFLCEDELIRKKLCLLFETLSRFSWVSSLHWMRTMRNRFCLFLGILFRNYRAKQRHEYLFIWFHRPIFESTGLGRFINIWIGEIQFVSVEQLIISQTIISLSSFFRSRHSICRCCCPLCACCSRYYYYFSRTWPHFGEWNCSQNIYCHSTHCCRPQISPLDVCEHSSSMANFRLWSSANSLPFVEDKMRTNWPLQRKHCYFVLVKYGCDMNYGRCRWTGAYCDDHLAIAVHRQQRFPLWSDVVSIQLSSSAQSSAIDCHSIRWNERAWSAQCPNTVACPRIPLWSCCHCVRRSRLPTPASSAIRGCSWATWCTWWTSEGFHFSIVSCRADASAPVCAIRQMHRTHFAGASVHVNSWISSVPLAHCDSWWMSKRMRLATNCSNSVDYCNCYFLRPKTKREREKGENVKQFCFSFWRDLSRYPGIEIHPRHCHSAKNQTNRRQTWSPGWPIWWIHFDFCSLPSYERPRHQTPTATNSVPPIRPGYLPMRQLNNDHYSSHHFRSNPFLAPLCFTLVQ